MTAALLSTIAACSSSTGEAEEQVPGGTYADGTYTATGWYGGLPSSITVSVDLEDDRITDVEVTTHATDPTSLDYQTRFARAIPDIVIGRPIDDIRVTRVAGSSGTPQGFTDALERIKAQAVE